MLLTNTERIDFNQHNIASSTKESVL